MNRDEIWGIPLHRARGFFAGQPDVAEGPENFVFRSCRITLTRLPDRPMGSWTLPRTRVVMEGLEEDVAAIHRRFFMAFLSAGG